jgi:Glycosyltransferase
MTNRLLYAPLKGLDLLAYAMLKVAMGAYCLLRSCTIRPSQPKRPSMLCCDDFGIDAYLRYNALEYAETEASHPLIARTYHVSVSSRPASVRRLGKKVVFINIHRPSIAGVRRRFPHTARGWASLAGLAATSRLLLRLQPLAVETLSPNPLLPRAGLLAWMHRTRLMVQVRGNADLRYHYTHHPAYFPFALRSKTGRTILALWDDLVQRFFYGGCDLVIGYNVNNMQSAISKGAHPDVTHLLRIAIDWNIQQLPLRPREELEGFPKDGKVAVLWSRLEPQKFVGDCYDHMRSLLLETPDLHLAVIGEGSMKEVLRSRSLEDGLSDRVHLLGSRRLEFIRSAAEYSDVVLVPLGGSSLVEAALLARPVVAFNIEWHSELINDGVTGLLADKNVPGDMGRKTAEILADPKGASIMGEQCRKAAMVMFDAEALQRRERIIMRGFLAHTMPGAAGGGDHAAR